MNTSTSTTQGSITQGVTDELRRWIIDQAEAGCRPQDVLAAMQKSGWHEDVAMAAMEETLTAHLARRQREKASPAGPAETTPASSAVPAQQPVPVPEPDLKGGASWLEVEGHRLSVVMTMRQPRVIVFGGLLSDAECDGLIEQARPRLARSETVDTRTGDSEVNVARTSDGMFFERGESPLIQRIERRISLLLGWPVLHGEGLQILHYRPGAEYKPHHDYFDPAHSGTPRILQRGGQRVGTLVMYLNTPEAGGATTFPDVGLEVAPVRGNAVFFSYDRAHPDTRTLHGGAPVVAGEKWVATKWLREGEFH
ncbi:MAG: 2OG-Fe(II) oxygenase [Rubrivivax sp.]|nr:2OG-Fe(II) oxygenase [Rubrivivax sp.]